MGRVLAFVLVVAVAAATAAVAFASQSPKALRKAVFAAARQQHSVHYAAQSVDRNAGSRTTFVCDVAADRGIQQITYTLGHKTGHVTIEVVKHTAYVRGDAFTLRDYLGLPKGKAKRDRGHWISVPDTNPSFPAIAASVTFGSFIHALDLQIVQRRITGTVGGQRVVGLVGKSLIAGSLYDARLFVRASGKPLPVQETTTTTGMSAKTTVSRWNETVRVSAPANAVPITAHGPAGGPAA